ncbi:unnamed protein product [Trichogramma brassicae]|uniref:Uncharacterized protein n=1 Tax=Trichogramma brassicae TaxID=86971 RepID=A0A6H5JA68_9HYME|nr:unnamed protein product [Trichogramma brassicae]
MMATDIKTLYLDATDSTFYSPVELFTQAIPVRDGTSIVELGKQLLNNAKMGDTEAVRDLMCRGAPFTCDWLGTSALHLAAQNNHTETAEVLLRAGISKDSKTKVDRTPLHMAAYEGHLEMVELLLSYGAEVDCKDMLKMTPLHWSVEQGHIDVMILLLDHGADPYSLSKFHKTPITLALEQKKMDLVDIMQQDRQVVKQTDDVNNEQQYMNSEGQSSDDYIKFEEINQLDLIEQLQQQQQQFQQDQMYVQQQQQQQLQRQHQQVIKQHQKLLKQEKQLKQATKRKIIQLLNDIYTLEYIWSKCDNGDEAAFASSAIISYKYNAVRCCPRRSSGEARLILAAGLAGLYHARCDVKKRQNSSSSSSSSSSSGLLHRRSDTHTQFCDSHTQHMKLGARSAQQRNHSHTHTLTRIEVVAPSSSSRQQRAQFSSVQFATVLCGKVAVVAAAAAAYS